jgi:hypothetical protein
MNTPHFLAFGQTKLLKKITLETWETFHLFRWIDLSIADQLITLSSDPNDEVLQISVPNDKKRFWDIEKLQTWYHDGVDNDQVKYFYYFADGEGKLAAIAWLRKSSLPVMQNDAQNGLSELLDWKTLEDLDVHTEAFRVYPPFRGKKLWNYILLEATNNYKIIGNTGIVIGDVDEWNVASQKVHIAAGYTNIWHGEAAKTGSHGEKRILFAKVI